LLLALMRSTSCSGPDRPVEVAGQQGGDARRIVSIGGEDTSSKLCSGLPTIRIGFETVSAGLMLGDDERTGAVGVQRA